MSFLSSMSSTECIEKFLRFSDESTANLFRSALPGVEIALKCLDLLRSRLIVRSCYNSFLSADLEPATPSQFVDSILYLCRFKYPLVSVPVDTIPNVWFKCVCQECPSINCFTPFECGVETFRFDWLTERTSNMFFDNKNVDKLLNMVSISNTDLLKEEVYITAFMQNEMVRRVFREPVVAVRNYLRSETGAVPSRKSQLLTATACGCGSCPVAEKLYWEHMGSSSHVSNSANSRNEFVANITLHKCSVPFVTKHSWMKRVFLNVLSLNRIEVYDRMPTYAAFEELVKEIGITDEDLERLCKGKVRKSYFNLLYGARPMMLLVRVMQKGLKIHVPWHIYNDARVKKKAQPYIDRILAEEFEETNNPFSSMTKRELTIRMRDTELKATVYERDMSDLLVKAKWLKPQYVTEYEVLPRYKDFYNRAIENFDRMINTCLIHLDFDTIVPPWHDYQVKIAEFAEGYVDHYESLTLIKDTKFKNKFGPKGDRLCHPCTPEKYRKRSHPTVSCQNFDKAVSREMRDIRIELRSSPELVARAKEKHRNRIIEGNKLGDKMIEIANASCREIALEVANCKVKQVEVEDILQLEPRDLLIENGEKVLKPGLSKLANLGIFLVARSVRQEVNEILAECEYPFYFDAQMKVQWMGASIPRGRSSNYHKDKLFQKVWDKIQKCKITDIVDDILKEKFEIQLMRNHMILAAKTLRNKALKQCQSRWLRTQFSMLPAEKVLEFNSLIKNEKVSVVKEKVGLTNGLIKKIMVLPIKKLRERERFRE
jgi:hypothetical protein